MSANSAERYRTVRKLGSGGMATVFLAEDTLLGRYVAVKRLPASSPEDLARRFQREARLGASLHHHNLVTIFDTIAGDDGLLIVMEYVEGRDLGSVLEDGPMPPVDALDVLRQVADGLGYAHRYGVVHRDVKPANILIGDVGLVKLADLGIALAHEATRLTASDLTLGTPSFMAPEQLTQGEITPAVDVYALATVAYEALSGHRARPGRNPLEIARRVIDERPPDVRDVWPEAPAAAATALRAGMARDPAKRPSSARELVDELGAALSGRGKEVGAAAASERDSAPEAAAPERGLPSAAAAPERDSAPVGAAPSPPAPVAATRRPRRRTLAIGALAAALVGGGAAAATIATTGGSPAAKHPPAANGVAQQRGGGHGAAAPGGSGSDRRRAATAAVEPADGTASTPAGAVQAFYRRQAAHRYQAAWSLADPTFRAQEHSFDAFTAQSSSLRDITFERAQTVSRHGREATVAIRTTAVHTGRTDHCDGTVDVAPAAGGGWVLHHIDVECTPRPT